MATPIPKNEAPFTTFWIAAATGGEVRGDGKRGRGITTDSREVVPGGAFVAIRGERMDGHAYVESAVAKGASVVVVERGRAPEVRGADVVEVDDTLRAWGDIARAHLRRWRRRRANASVVAITGSAGKTTTKELTAALLRADAATHATAGNLNNRLGLPAVALAVTDDVRYLVLEAGMNQRGEIAELARIAEHDIAVITNVGVAHAEGVGGGRAGVAREKGALVEALRSRGVAVVNAHDDAASAQLVRTTARAETFGRSPSASYVLLERTPLGARGSRVVVRRASGVVEVDLPLIGEAAAIDFAAALAAADAAKGEPLGAATVRRAFASFRPAAGRGELKPLEDGTLLIDDSYNANPASMRASLESAAEVARAGGRRLVVVLGEMKELGDEAEREHAALGDAIAKAGASLAIGCGGLVERALDRAGPGVAIVKAPDTAAAAREAEARVRPGDVVLVKGSRGVATERVVEALVGSRGAADASRESG